MYILDTNIVSEIVKPDPNWGAIDWMQDHEGELYLTTVTLMEMHFGYMCLPEGKRKNGLKEHVEGIAQDCADHILEFDSFSAYCCAEFRSKTKAIGRTPQLSDCMIAAICARHGATLVTHNVKDFDCYGIDVFDPFDYESETMKELRRREAERK